MSLKFDYFGRCTVRVYICHDCQLLLLFYVNNELYKRCCFNQFVYFPACTVKKIIKVAQSGFESLQRTHGQNGLYRVFKLLKLNSHFIVVVITRFTRSADFKRPIRNVLVLCLRQETVLCLCSFVLSQLPACSNHKIFYLQSQ